MSIEPSLTETDTYKFKQPTGLPSTFETIRVAKASHIQVRKPKEIPSSLLAFFQKDPRLGRPYSPQERVFQAQVFLHELDEGTRLLQRQQQQQWQQQNQKKSTQSLQEIFSKVPLANQLALLRSLLQKTPPRNPESVQEKSKIRNNQDGAFSTKLQGKHPVYALTENGGVERNCNEDAFLVMPREQLVCLSDGMGGHNGGEIASCVAVDFLEYGITQGMSLEKAIVFANEALIARSGQDPELGGAYPMGCTLAAVQIHNNLLKVAHVGDTKAMVVRKEKICFETRDHTRGQQLLREGLVDPKTAFDLNHLLNRCLGMEPLQTERDVSQSEIYLEAGDRILILTDGLTDNFFVENFNLDSLAKLASNGTILQAAKRILRQNKAFFQEDQLPSGHPPKRDNLSLAIVEFEG